MKAYLILLLIALWQSPIAAQKTSTPLPNKVSNDQLEAKQIISIPPQKVLKFDFKIADAAHFEQQAKENKDITNTENYNYDFELTTWDKKTIDFKCSEKVKETCPTYLGYSESMEVYLVRKCKDVCNTLLIDAANGSTILLPTYFDGGSTPLLSYKYMLVYSSYSDDSFDEYYDTRSIIEVYKILDYTEALENRFEYLGSFQSRNWSIAEIVFNVDKPNAFVLKLYEEEEEFSYVEMEWW